MFITNFCMNDRERFIYFQKFVNKIKMNIFAKENDRVKCFHIFETPYI